MVVSLETLNEVTVGNVVTDVDEFDGIEVPLEFVALTENVYAVFADNPDTIIGEDTPFPMKAPGLLVTVYPVMIPVPLGDVK